jgi:hypothetical protein
MQQGRLERQQARITALQARLTEIDKQIANAQVAGTPVLAAFDGIVKFANRVAGYGNEIALTHGAGSESRYAHLDRFAVREGEQVTKGQVIGYSGQSGVATGPHLHYEVLVNGKKVDPSRGKFPIDPTTVAQSAEAAGKALTAFGDQASERISRITEAFDAQPRAIDRATQATRELQDLYSQLKTKDLLDPETEKRITNARAAIEDSFNRPLRDMHRDSDRDIQVQNLISQGREAEANAMQRIWQYEDTMRPLTAARKQEILEITKAEEAHNIALERSRALQQSYLSASQDIRSQIEGMFNGQAPDFNATFRKLNSAVISQQLFGGMFDDLDQWVKKNTGLGKATNEFTTSTARAGQAAGTLADSILAAAAKINGMSDGSHVGLTDLALGRGPANDNELAATGAFGVGSAIAKIAGLGTGLLDPITVTGKSGAATKVLLDRNTVGGMSPDQFAQQLGTRFGDVVTDGLSDVLGPKLAQTLGGVAGGAFYGNIVGGTPGALLGAIKGISGLPEGVSNALGKGLKGMETGSLIAGLSNSIGIKMSTSGSQIGGAIGSVIPGVGSVIGSVVGGLLGGLFKKTPYGSAAVSNGSVTIGGNNADAKGNASYAGDAVNSALSTIVDRLGGTLGQYAVSIGLNNGNWNVNPGLVSGKIGTKQQKDSIDFKKDADAALAWAIKNAIEDGAIQGVRAGTQAILRVAKDVDKGVQDALDFENIFARLKSYTDPVGAALDTLDKEFSRYRQLAITAGEGMVETEELYGKERQKVLEQVAQQTVGSLKNLYSQLTVGDSGLSLRERQANAQAEYDPLAARVAAGDTSAFDAFTSASQTLLDVSRQLYGSQDAYFAVYNSIHDLTKSTIDSQTNIAAIAAGRDSPFSNSSVPATDNAAVVSAIDAQTQAIIAALSAQGFTLSAMNDNIGALIQQGQLSGAAWTGFNYAGGW